MVVDTTVVAGLVYTTEELDDGGLGRVLHGVTFEAVVAGMRLDVVLGLATHVPKEEEGGV